MQLTGGEGAARVGFVGASPLVRAEGGDLEPIVVLHFHQPLGLKTRNHEHAGQACDGQQTSDETVHVASNREVRGWARGYCR